MKTRVKLSLKVVTSAASLSALTLPEPLLQDFRTELSAVLTYVAKLEQLNTAALAETSQVTSLVNVFRPDKLDKQRMLTQKQALSQAAKTHRGYFVAKAVL